MNKITKPFQDAMYDATRRIEQSKDTEHAGQILENPPDPEAGDRFQVKLSPYTGFVCIRDRETSMVYRATINEEMHALAHLMNELVKPTKKKRKRRSKPRPDKFNPRDVAILGGDPSL